ncbi:hypothetical protein [Niveispirillum sp. KHB5.9]|uniref:hypothetical protein n=1 Tax=Niveispirillum sp. KHB5.9 TaxID=3400269 RepID=UPI003A8C476B
MTYNLYQLHSDGSIWGYVGPAITGWTKLGDNPQTVQIATDESSGALYQLGNDGTISIYEGTPLTGWKQLASNGAVAITAGKGGLYQLQTTGMILSYNGTGWTVIDTNPLTVVITVDQSNGNLYQQHNDGSVWLYDGTPLTGWTKLNPDNPAFAVTAGSGLVHILTGTGDVMVNGGPGSTSWATIQSGTSISSVGIAVDQSNGQLYQLQNINKGPLYAQNGSIWQYTPGASSSWLEIDNNPIVVSITAGGGSVYQLHNDGSIWIYTSPPISGWEKLDVNPLTVAILAGGGTARRGAFNVAVGGYQPNPFAPNQMMSAGGGKLSPDGTLMSVNGATNLTLWYNPNSQDGASLINYRVTQINGVIYKYQINAYAGAFKIVGSLHITSTDATGDTYEVEVISNAPSQHSVSYNSSNPAIVSLILAGDALE